MAAIQQPKEDAGSHPLPSEQAEVAVGCGGGLPAHLASTCRCSKSPCSRSGRTVGGRFAFAERSEDGKSGGAALRDWSGRCAERCWVCGERSEQCDIRIETRHLQNSLACQCRNGSSGRGSA